MSKTNKETSFGETRLSIEKLRMFRDKLETMPTKEALDVLFHYYGYRNLLSEEFYNESVADGLIENIW